MKRLPLLVFAALLALAGCATRPQDIRPAYVSEAGFRSLSIEQMQSRQDYLAAELRSACAEQHKTRALDSALCVFGGPPSLLTPKDTRDRIAQLKGELLALQSAAAAAGYSLPPVDVEAVARRAP